MKPMRWLLALLVTAFVVQGPTAAAVATGTVQLTATYVYDTPTAVTTLAANQRIDVTRGERSLADGPRSMSSVISPRRCAKAGAGVADDAARVGLEVGPYGVPAGKAESETRTDTSRITVRTSAQNALDYVRRAHQFLHRPPGSTLTRARPNGDIVRYEPISNTFGVMTRSGAPRTFFRPDPAKHGHPSNLDYFLAQ